MNVRRFAVGLGTSLVIAATALVTAQAKDTKTDPRPRTTLQARPVISMSPTRIVLTAELVGGANDFEEYYCPTIQWEWGDDTTSEVTSDCEPYEAGKSEIKRRYTVQHIYRRSGTYQITFRLKRRDRQLAMATTTVEVRPGSREIIE